MQQVLVYTKRFYEVYDVRPEIQEPKEPVKTKSFKGHVIYSEVSFGYRPERMVLKDISIDIAPGTRVGIVGETGGGKSTLMKLLPRFYDPQKGLITIDGVDVRTMALEDLRSRIGMVFQQPFLFVGSIYDNIICGRGGFKQDQVIAAAKDACANEFITNLPEGYETLVGEKGVTLSGGEQQRIALARLFLLNRPILILDEATSNIDQKTEAQIQEVFRKLAKGRTTFIIAHRLSTVKDADIILVMQNGRIVERGSHLELMEKKEFYFRLYHRTSMTEFPDHGNK
jgi:ATP-binding cassette subfamily B protein